MRNKDELRIIAVNGCIGYGYEFASLDRGIDLRPDLIGADAGSTDAGPYYLGSGTSMVRREQVKRDLAYALLKARACKAPLVIGSAGIGGGEPQLQVMREILIEAAREQGLHFRLALIHAEIPHATVLGALADNGIEPMPSVGPLSAADVEQSVRIVGQMGTGPFADALAGGADVVLAGRACDTAIYAAMPIARGFDPGLALHLAKIMECGAQCGVPLAPNDSLMGILREDHFLVRPLHADRICTPESVAAHTMYEQGDPLWLHEPEGKVDLSNAVFEQVDRQTVRVSGARFIPTPQLSIKLEGARRIGFRAFALAGIRDEKVISNLDTIERMVRDAVRRNLDSAISDDAFQLQFKVYGRDAVLGMREPLRHQLPHEVGVLVEVVADTQALASYVLSLARSSFLHCPFPGRKTTAGNAAFPFSPSDVAAGEVFDFSIYHLMRVHDQAALFPIEWESV